MEKMPKELMMSFWRLASRDPVNGVGIKRGDVRCGICGTHYRLGESCPSQCRARPKEKK